MLLSIGTSVSVCLSVYPSVLLSSCCSLCVLLRSTYKLSCGLEMATMEMVGVPTLAFFITSVLLCWSGTHVLGQSVVMPSNDSMFL